MAAGGGGARGVEAKLSTLLLASDPSTPPSIDRLRQQLESKDDASKIEALKSIITFIAAGENMSRLLMSVIKFCLHSENHTVKKLLLLYWEVVDKTKPDGSLLPEMILVCNAMKNNLVHANEFIRGSTLRFLCYIKQPEILESLVTSITANLDHRHSYVRKNAVLAVHSVYTVSRDLLPNAPELIEKFLYQESNSSAKRNAFLMLSQCDVARALSYLNTVLESLASTGDAFHLAALDLILSYCRQNPAVKGQYVRHIFNLTNSGSNAVAFEAANVLVALSGAPTAVRAAVNAYTRLLVTESDSNVKLVIVNKLIALKRKHERVLQEMLMDVLRALSAPNIDLRRKLVALALELVTPRNVEEVVQLFKKEIIKTENPEEAQQQNVDEYRKLLIDALHECAIKFPEVVQAVVQVLLNYVGEEKGTAAMDVIFFVREIVEENASVRDAVVARLVEGFGEICSSPVFRVALWVLGEYALDATHVDRALEAIKEAVGPLPLFAPPAAADAGDGAAGASGAAAATASAAATSASGPGSARGAPNAASAPGGERRKAPSGASSAASGPSASGSSGSSRPAVLADGTYAQQSAVIENRGASAVKRRETLRSLISGGDFFLGASLCSAVTKLVLRFCTLKGYGTPVCNAEIARALLLFTSVLRLGTAADSPVAIDLDSRDRVQLCIRALLNPKAFSEIFLRKGREAFASMLRELRRPANEEAARKKAGHAQPGDVVRQVDDLIAIRQLKTTASADDFDDDAVAGSAAGSRLGAGSGARGGGGSGGGDNFKDQLSRVFQLTGFSDPVYAEAYMRVFHYDIVFELLVVNQTNRVLQNLTVELSTSRDLKLMDRPQAINVAPYDFVKLPLNIKVSSTENGVIFGNIVYDNTAGTDQTVVVLNSVHVDIADYIRPATCDAQTFRTMWQEFEWENKVAVITDIRDVGQYLRHLVKITNMQCLTPDATLSGSCAFLAANFYARSIFGEDALLNLSIEQDETGKIIGYIRIRSKAQGIALSLGDKIGNFQKSERDQQAA
jgi:coatomer subunit beta